MKNIIQSFIVAIAMYSKIPVPNVEWNKDNMKYAKCFFPFIGAIIGGAVYAVANLLALSEMSNVFNTCILILIPVIITGGIHLDGLLDTADALSSFQTMERRLEILKDSNAGAFAIIIGIAYFILDFGVWYELTLKALPIIAVGYVLSRALSGLAVVTFKCARNSGLAATFSDMAHKKTVRNTMFVYIVVCIGLMLFLNPILGGLGILTAAICFIWYRQMSYSKFGGITGDLAGFFLQVCELAIAFVVIIGSKYIG